jgi:Protein of unknown function (DUF3455)
MKLLTLSGCALAALTLPIMANAAAPGQSVLAVVQAQGAQVYECKADATGNLAWQFREPIATLIQDGKTVGRHYAGPTWEFADGGAVVGKVVERTAGATPTDIPSLKLEATSHRGAGVLANVMSIERLNTHGGMAEGPCPAAGALIGVAYTADYVFYGIAHDNRQGTLEPSREPPVAGPAKVRLSLVSSAVK